jgi:methylenetetrahydrofolate reductase (NADPH)
MRVDEVIGRGPIVSFEFLPPRNAEAELALWATIDELARFEPAFVAVTCRPGTRDLTLAIVRRVARERGLEAVPHVIARSDARELLEAVRAGGADNVLALRGDEVEGTVTSLDLTRMAADLGFCVLGAAYPEPHPDSRGATADIEYLKAKVDAGVRVLITQLFFDNSDYLRLVERLAAAGVDVPVIPGIFPITRIAQVGKLVSLTSATIPTGLRRELEARQDDPRAVEDLGVAYATAQASGLLAAGAPGVHLYTFNRSPATRAVVSALRATGALAGSPREIVG